MFLNLLLTAMQVHQSMPAKGLFFALFSQTGFPLQNSGINVGWDKTPSFAKGKKVEDSPNISLPIFETFQQAVVIHF